MWRFAASLIFMYGAAVSLCCKPEVEGSILGRLCSYVKVFLDKTLNLVIKLAPSLAAAVISVWI